MLEGASGSPTAEEDSAAMQVTTDDEVSRSDTEDLVPDWEKSTKGSTDFFCAKNTLGVHSIFVRNCTVEIEIVPNFGFYFKEHP